MSTSMLNKKGYEIFKFKFDIVIISNGNPSQNDILISILGKIQYPFLLFLFMYISVDESYLWQLRTGQRNKSNIITISEIWLILQVSCDDGFKYVLNCARRKN